MKENMIETVCNITHVDIVLETHENTLKPFFIDTEQSPLVHSDALRSVIRMNIETNDGICFLIDPDEFYYAGLQCSEGYVYIGPMSDKKHTTVQCRKMLKRVGIDAKEPRQFHGMTLPEMRDIILLVNTLLDNPDIEKTDIPLFKEIEIEYMAQEDTEKLQFRVHEEEADEANAYRHGYKEEQELMLAVKEGRTKDAIRLCESMDRDEGRLSNNDFNHRRYIAIIGISLCSRAAIEGGLSPSMAYKLSGYYIQKCDNATSNSHLLYLRNHAIEDITSQVHSVQKQTHGSNYVAQCKNYIQKHYREKISLDELSEALLISPSHLSRTFKKETGINIQDYINQVRIERAQQLLCFSNYTLAEIAEYVHFPSQSYFGKVFKQFKGMSPKQFRDRFKTDEINA